ncbi:mitochondrial substrate carrier family protein [Actinidia rufa]|uniref:Mitochondrial substrate carrier family protein n=1 Tax=Actinidia rufa TaxID=165716 RepID=A0A7J0G1I6_9ERIC|nr:mitochondrial substrate carrier family protein [Actinidia rufa]
MQLVGWRGPLTGMGRLFGLVVKSEGPKSFYLGLIPAFVRSVFYGGLRLGLYEPRKYVYCMAFESSNVLVKIAFGAFSGAIATALTQPHGSSEDESKSEKRNNTRIAQKCFRRGYISSLEGVGPEMTRAAALTASQLATYDESKRILMRLTPLEEGFYLHLISSTIAGTVSTLITAPMDIIKTCLMLQRESKNLGPTKMDFIALTSGFAIFVRLRPQTMITLILYEKLRELAGLKAV